MLINPFYTPSIEDQIVYAYLDDLIKIQTAAFLRKLEKSKNQIKTAIKKKGITTGLMTVAVFKKAKNTWEYLDIFKPNLLTNGGRDFIHNQAYTNTSAGTIGANYVGVTTNSGAPAAGDTTLTGEIAINGLQRAQASASHSAGTNTSTLSITYTASGTHTGVQKAATFNASSSGTMVHENTFTSTDLVSGDQLALVWTLTLG